MPSERARLSLDQLGRALIRFEEALEAPPAAPFVLDATVQRFEFVFELSWKTLMLVLAEDGIESRSPREAIRAAYAAELIDSEDVWLRLLQARNETSHTYNEEVARKVYEVVKASAGEMRRLFEALGHRFSEPK